MLIMNFKKRPPPAPSISNWMIPDLNLITKLMSKQKGRWGENGLKSRDGINSGFRENQNGSRLILTNCMRADWIKIEGELAKIVAQSHGHHQPKQPNDSPSLHQSRSKLGRHLYERGGESELRKTSNYQVTGTYFPIIPWLITVRYTT